MAQWFNSWEPELDERLCAWLDQVRKGEFMRRRLERFLPIVLIAALVQIFAPIGVTWAASIAASDPLHAVPICHGAATPGPDQSSQSSAHQGCCSVCSGVHNGAPVDAPQAV